MFRKTFRRQKNGKTSTYYAIVESVWNHGKPTYRTILSLGAMPEATAHLLCRIVASEQPHRCTMDDVVPTKSYAFLRIAVLHARFSAWQLEAVLAPLGAKSPTYADIESVTALVINRSLAPWSKLRLPAWSGRTFLPKLTGMPADALAENLLYRVMDALLPLEAPIQQHLYRQMQKRYPTNVRLVLYDLTSSDFEGMRCSLGRYGSSREHRPDKLHIVLGLVVTEDGFPFSGEVFPGNQVDMTTLPGPVACLKERFALSACVLVADRGLVSAEKLATLQGTLSYILRTDVPREDHHPLYPAVATPLAAFREETVHEQGADVFQAYAETLYYPARPVWGGHRHILCCDLQTYRDARRSREPLLQEVEPHVQAMHTTLLQAKRTRAAATVTRQLERVLQRKTVTRFFRCELRPTRCTVTTAKGAQEIATWQIPLARTASAIEKAARFDGAYRLIADLRECDPTTGAYRFPPPDLITAYKQRVRIEEAFQVITAVIHLRPISHHVDDRVRAHGLICVLASRLDRTVEAGVHGISLPDGATIYQTVADCTFVAFSLQGPGKKAAVEPKGGTTHKLIPPTPTHLEILRRLGCHHLVSPNSRKRVAL